MPRFGWMARPRPVPPKIRAGRVQVYCLRTGGIVSNQSEPVKLKGVTILTTMTEAVESRVMTGYEPGIRARRAIIRELARREAAGLKSPSMTLLGDILGLHWSTVSDHVKILVSAGLVRREGYRMFLTDCGKGAAETLIEP